MRDDALPHVQFRKGLGRKQAEAAEEW